MKKTSLVLLGCALWAFPACAKKQKPPEIVSTAGDRGGADRVAQPTLAKAEAPPPEGARRARPGDDTILFNFDSHILGNDARPVLQKVGDWLKENPSAKVRIEGHCDERGTDEYNLALGEERARSAQSYLERLGVERSRIEIATYGSHRPRDQRSTEAAWAKNRRDEIKPR